MAAAAAEAVRLSRSPAPGKQFGYEGKCDHQIVSVPADYDSDPQRWNSFQAPQDVHDTVAQELHGPVLDAGCGDGRLAAALAGPVSWVGLDSSPAQLAANPFRPVVQGDLTALPFPDASFAEVTHLWCLYHLQDPLPAVREARRVLRPGGRYYASTAARDNDPELIPDGYPPTSFDAEDAVSIVASVFQEVEGEHWNGKFYPLSTRDEIRAYCRHHYIPPERAEQVQVPLWLTKRGILVRARKH
jgi:SAM-dependent methyltransferase